MLWEHFLYLKNKQTNKPKPQLGELDIKIKDEVVRALIDTIATLSVLNSNMLSVSPAQTSEFIQIVGVANQPMTVPKSIPIPFHLRPLISNHHFLLVLSALIHFLGRDFLRNLPNPYFLFLKGRSDVLIILARGSFL